MSVYITPCGTGFRVCKDGREISDTYNSYFSAWMRREAERRAAR